MTLNTSKNCGAVARQRGAHTEKVEVQGDYRIKDGTSWIYEKVVIHTRLFEPLCGIYSFCGVHCPRYDTKSKEESTWRGLDLNQYFS